MKQGLKYILLIIIVSSFGKIFAQSLIMTGFVQTDTICEGTTGRMKLAMYNSVETEKQKVFYFKLMFEYDATLMKIENVTTKNAILGDFEVSYPVSGQCMIIDTLAIPNNFRDTSFTTTALFFDVYFTGLHQGVGQVRFISDSCYFKTEEDENIAAFYQDSRDVNIHPGFIEMTLTQTGIGCSYEDKGQAEITVTDGVSPYKYEWSEGMQNSFYPNQAGQLSEGEVKIRIIDGNGCLHDTTMMIETLRAPEIDWTYETLYSETPEFAVKEHPIHFYVTDIGDGYNWNWKAYYTDPVSGIRDSLHKERSEWEKIRYQTDFQYVFLIDNDYEIWLSAQSLITGCDTTIIKEVKVEPAQLDFKNLVTPGSNRFKIDANTNQKLRDVFVSHVLIIQDRTGRKVYETKDFPDDGWDGGGCPNGTYYFILKAKSTRKEYKYQGTLVILGGK